MVDLDRAKRLRDIEVKLKSTDAARQRALAKVAIQSAPYIYDRMGGFAIQLKVSSRKDHRFVLVILESGKAEARLFDTVAAQNRDLDDACVATLQTDDWDVLAAFISEKAGVRFDATYKGRPAAIRLSGRYVAIHEVTEEGTAESPCALIDFVSGHGPNSVQVSCFPNGPNARGLFLAGWDWIIIESELLANGITFKPSNVASEPGAGA